MGCSSSCAIFAAFSTALEWLAMHRFGASCVLHILDDLLFIADSKEKCQSDLANFLTLCEYLGVSIAQEKTVGPKNRLPNDKLQKCCVLLYTFSRRRKISLKKLQSLLGLLNFTCAVVVPGRAFLRRMIDLTTTRGVKRPQHHIRLTKEAKHDIKVWLNFLDEFNGRAFFLDDRWETSCSMKFFIVAAGSKGYGAIFGNQWFYGA